MSFKSSRSNAKDSNAVVKLKPVLALVSKYLKRFFSANLKNQIKK